MRAPRSGRNPSSLAQLEIYEASDLAGALIARQRSNMRILLCPIVVAVLSIATIASAGADPSLTGKMAWWQRVVGTWNCTLRLFPVAGQPAGTGPASLVALASAANTIHMYSVAYENQGDAYIGYSDKERRWWEADADNTGDATLITSRDNVVYTQVSDATSSVDKDTDVFRVSYAFRNGVFSQRQELEKNNAWILASVETCHRHPKV
jgi:hypothetical protein